MKRTFKVKKVKVTKADFDKKNFSELKEILIQSDKDELEEVKKIYGEGNYNVEVVRTFEGTFEMDNTRFINSAKQA